ncbi:MAG: GNAT family N-acetyltransferase [Acidobacteriia bacterium]|nr:GNAT family N-acetyltransferase [Terriglobia bacterium]
MIEIRPLSALAEFSEAVTLEQGIWGFADFDVVPLPLFVVARETGGQTFGAYEANRMIGFCLALAGLKPDGRPFLHSHMLAVLPSHRDAGVGRSLKLQQRADALARGIELIEWTFDPLELKNAFFNIERLGAIVRRYHENEYGATSSPLHSALPTDRCVAEWWIGSPRVQSVLAGESIERQVDERIAVPVEIERLRREDPGRARAIQSANAERFQRSFSRGLAVIGFERAESEGVYLLGRPV